MHRCPRRQNERKFSHGAPPHRSTCTLLTQKSRKNDAKKEKCASHLSFFPGCFFLSNTETQGRTHSTKKEISLVRIRLYKWSRRELNSCPKTDPLFFYYHSLLFNIPSAPREQTPSGFQYLLIRLTVRSLPAIVSHISMPDSRGVSASGPTQAAIKQQERIRCR